MTPQQQAAALRDPVLFQRRILGRKLWQKQKEIIRSAVDNPLTAVAGCHASGKTFVATGIIPWHLIRHRENNKVFTTAPTLRQVTSHWKDVHSTYDESKLLRQMLPPPNVLGWQVGPNRYATGASSSAGVNIAGLHARHVFILADESPGINGSIWDDIEGLRAGGSVRVLMLGNPVVASGQFYDAFTRNRAIYNCISISAYDTPNFQHPDGRTVTEAELLAMSPEELAYTPFPSLITRAWVRERLIVWGSKHPKYLSRVLGQFPPDDPYSCFPLGSIERARREPTEEEIRLALRMGWIQVGIDVAGAGSDETSLTVRCGGIILEQHAWPNPDPRGPVLAILARLRSGRYEWKPTALEPTAPEWFKRLPPMPLAKVVVDVIGIGYNFALHLADQGFPVYGFNAGARPIDTLQFVNQKAEAHWTFRTYLERNEVSNLTDEETAAQLSTIRYRENSRGLTEIESKDERNKRGIPGSPDRAESTIDAFLTVRPAERGAVFDPSDYRISVV